MPVQIYATLGGIAITALIGFVVFLYRPTVTTQLLSLQHSIGLKELGLSAKSEFLIPKIQMERITIRNAGWRAIAPFAIHLEGTKFPFDYRVAFTSSLSKTSVKLNEIENHLEIYLDNLPIGEKVVVEIASSNGGYGGEWRNFRSSSGSFRVVRESTYKALWSLLRWFAFLAFLLLLLCCAMGDREM